ncbi:MAG: type II and III secretion system protein family protein [Acidobacteriaceae bacterium]
MPETESVHVLVGRSIVINMQARLRKVYLSNPAVVESATTSPTQVIITAKAPGSSNIVFWDETGHSRILELYSDVDVSGLRNAVGEEYPGQTIGVRAEEGRVIVSGTVSDKDVADNIAKMALSYSKDVVNGLVVNSPHSKQIMLKVRFAEVDRSKLQAFGMNLFSTGATNTIGTVSTQAFGPPTLSGTVAGKTGSGTTASTSSFSITDLLNIFLFRPDLNLGLTLKDLQQRSILQILAEPNLLSMSGQTAHFLAGGEFPYPVVQGSGGGTGLAVTIQFRPYGVKLDFTGTIQPDGSIRLKVQPEVSSLDYSNAVTISGFTIPALSTRRAETEVQLKDGQSFGIAGLLNSNTTIQLSKIPGIADVPILGQLFHSRSKNFTTSELLLLVTPTIVDPLESTAPPPPDPKVSVPPMTSSEFDRDGHK